jgi:hypothetical protein
MERRLYLVSDHLASTVLRTMPATEVIVMNTPKVQFDIPTSMVPNIE